MKLLRATAIWGTALAMLLGSPEHGSLAISRAEAAARLVCSSANFDYSYCRVDTRGGVRMLQQLSRAQCVQGRTWGTDPHGIWVDRGCSAQFAIGGSGNAGAIIGAAIIGGVVGAILGGSGSGDRDRPAPPHYRHDYRHEDSRPPAYDRYGNPNYDRKGRYDGCHGLGCTVDNPDAEVRSRSEDHSQDIDPRPQFNKDGDPNFDTEGNYVGCHAVGCSVDNPDAN